MKLTVAQIAKMYKVTPAGVRYWIKDKGLKTETEKVIGLKPRAVIDPKDVNKLLGFPKGHLIDDKG